MTLATRIEAVTGAKPQRIRALQGGMIGDVFRVDLVDGRIVVAKVAEGAKATLDIEGYMLNYLREHSDLPVPDVLHCEPDLLIMSFIPGESRLSAAVQSHAAELLAALHAVRGPQFGLERDTLAGPLHQPNPWTVSWIEFYRDQRLLYMAQEASDQGVLPTSHVHRIERLASRLDEFLLEPEHPTLIHGDMWTTNVLAQNGRVTGFVDPALYYAHAEMELAYSMLFGSFGDPFFERYQELRPIEPGFFDVRRHIYGLYHLLIHVRIFGAGYIPSVDEVLRGFGF